MNNQGLSKILPPLIKCKIACQMGGKEIKKASEISKAFGVENIGFEPITSSLRTLC